MLVEDVMRVFPPYSTGYKGLEDLLIEGTDKKYGAIIFNNGASISIKSVLLGKKDVLTGRYIKCTGNFVDKFLEVRASSKTVAEFEEALKETFANKTITVEYGKTYNYYNYNNQLTKGQLFVINYK